ncbi:hypothetical protein ACGRHY_28135 [Streptomyces sp. HK10]|uniref:hypothetical protein n=1 Tax=Streptomyces sp. HK10 TaxID=3373255 RepID=UPI003748D08C
MRPLPIPCPAPQVPDVTATDAFNTAYRAARTQSAVFIAVERSGRAWTVRADTLTAAPRHTLDDATSEAIRTAVTHLVRDRAIDSGSSPGPVHITLYGVPDEARARHLAAALHTALHGNPEPLIQLVGTPKPTSNPTV